MELTLGDQEEIKEKIKQKIDYRNNRHPMNYPSLGSTFKNISLDSLSPGFQKESNNSPADLPLLGLGLAGVAAAAAGGILFWRRRRAVEPELEAAPAPVAGAEPADGDDAEPAAPAAAPRRRPADDPATH